MFVNEICYQRGTSPCRRLMQSVMLNVATPSIHSNELHAVLPLTDWKITILTSNSQESFRRRFAERIVGIADVFAGVCKSGTIDDERRLIGISGQRKALTRGQLDAVETPRDVGCRLR
jgi:hypothetical protein